MTLLYRFLLVMFSKANLLYSAWEGSSFVHSTASSCEDLRNILPNHCLFFLLLVPGSQQTASPWNGDTRAALGGQGVVKSHKPIPLCLANQPHQRAEEGRKRVWSRVLQTHGVASGMLSCLEDLCLAILSYVCLLYEASLCSRV